MSRVPGVAQRETVRCRPGTYIFIWTADQRRNTALRFVLRRIRGTTWDQPAMTVSPASFPP